MLAECPADDPRWQVTQRAFLAETWRLPHAAAAVRHAAPDLADAVEGPEGLANSRTALALDRYLNRMSHRPTPFGLAAAVSGAPFVPAAGLRLAGPPTPRVRPDASWYVGDGDVAREEPDDSSVVLAAALAHTVDGHLWLEPRGHGRPVWLRRSGPAAALLRAAERPVPVADLVAGLTLRFGAPDQRAARALVHHLLRLGFLRRADSRVAPPRAVLDLCARVNASSVPAALPRGGPRLHVDAVAGLAEDAAVDPAIGQLAEQAASLLSIVGRGSRYPRYLARAAGAFTAHFGAHALVPALEAVHTLKALRVLSDGVEETEERGYERRDVLLAGLVADALAHRRIGCELDDALVARLTGHPDHAGVPRPPLPGADICLRVGRTPDGAWQAALSGPGAVPLGTAYGRFTDLLDARTRKALLAATRDEQAAAGARLLVELSYRPERSAAANLVAREVWRSWELPMEVAPSVGADRVLALSDVLVGVESGRFELRSARLGRRIHLTQASGLSLRLAPPVCRFLLDASANAFRHPAPFDWGPTAHGPFLPRLSRGPLIVSPARWRLEPASLTGDFAVAVRAWAAAWLVPRHVLLVQGDGRLLLDLHSGVSLAHLRAALDRAALGAVILEEAVPAPGTEIVTADDGGTYAVEVVVPVIAASAAQRELPLRAPRRADAHRPRLPGGEWLSVHLGLAAPLQDRLITGPLTELTVRIAELHGIDQVFFVRYADPADELRVRVRCGEPRAARLLDDVLAWAHEVGDRLPLTELGVRTYRRETDRYGGPELIGLAERLFCADSGAVADLLVHVPSTALPRPALTALTVDRIAAILVPDLTERRRLAIGSGDTRSGAAEYRSHGRGIWQARHSPGPVRDRLDALADRWAEDAPEYARGLADRWPETLGGQRRSVAVGALLHLHANRMGLSRAQERAALGMWRRLLDRDAARPTAPDVRSPTGIEVTP